ALIAAPGSLPGGQPIGWLSDWVQIAEFPAVAFVFLLFPTGRLLSRRWLPAAWYVAAALTLVAAYLVNLANHSWSHPLSPSAYMDTVTINPAVIVITVLIVAALVISVVAVLTRFVRSAGEERLQLKWFATAGVFAVAMFIGTNLGGTQTLEAVLNVLSSVAFLSLWVAITVAVLKYRLYDIDIVISKAVLYGSLAAFVTAAYIGLVAGLGALAGGRDRPIVTALAAAVVAVAFQPVRLWAARLANRVVYGRRATPYQ